MNSIRAKNSSSFVPAPVTAALNEAKTVVSNTMNRVSRNATTMASNLSEPLRQSYNAAATNGDNSLAMVPVMVILGILIISFILFVIFRDPIVHALELAWVKVKLAFGGSEPTAAVPPPPEFSAEANAPTIDKNAVEKILPGKKEVFNVAMNRYTYQDAEPVCKAFGAELATYDQVKEAWSKGADWCNYGWVKGQAAIYPTQSSTYEKLQAGPEDQRMACGVPGVNGGYFDNPDLRFGVNCYGTKPLETETDVRRKVEGGVMTADGLAYNRKVQEYKANLSDIPVNPFNESLWSS